MQMSCTVASIPLVFYGQDPTNFFPVWVRVLVDPGSMFTEYKSIIKLALTVIDQL